MKLIILLSFAIVSIVLAVNPGVKIQLNNPGLSYLKGIGMQVLNNHIKQIAIPDIKGSESILKYELSDFKIVSFTASNSNTQISIKAPRTVTLSARGVSATVTAHYKITVGSGWFSVSKSGSATAEASGVSFSQGIVPKLRQHFEASSVQVFVEKEGISVTQSNGKPHVTAGGSAVSIGDLKITFHGGIVDDIINLFSGIIASYLKGKLGDILKSELPKLINTDANSELNKIPTSIDVGHGFNIDYGLTGNPVVEGTNDVVIPFLGKIWYAGHQNDAKIPQALPMTGLQSGNSKMVCVEVSPNGLIGSLGYSTQVAGILHFDLTKALLQSFGVGQYMSCNCTGGKCIGGFIPQIKTQCGTGGSVEVNIVSSSPPAAMSNTSGIFMNFAATMDFKGDLPNGKKVELFTAQATMGAVIPAAGLQFSGWKIMGGLHVTGATFSIKSSNVGKLDQAGLQQIWQLALLSIVEGELDKLAKAGIPLPNLPDVKLLQPSITVGNHQITICSNLQYTGPTYHA